MNSLQPRTRQRLAACVAGLLLAMLAACGSSTHAVVQSGRLDVDGPTGPERYAQAVRLAGLARVEARAGLEQLAAEHWRAATRLGGEPIWVVEQAEAQERARLYAEARETAARALARDLNPSEKQRVDQLIARVTPQIPAGLVRVPVLVRPEGARVELSRADRKSRRGAERVLIGTGHAWLAPGTWVVETTAKGFNSELRTVQVGGDGSLVAIALVAEEQGAAMVNAQPEAEEAPAVVVAPPVAAPKPVVEPPPAAQPTAVVVVAPPPPPVEPPKPVEVAKPVEPPKPVEVAKPVEPPKPVEVAKPVEPPKPVEVAKPVEPSKPVEVAKPVEPPKPVEVAKPVEPSKPVEPPKPVEVAKPVEEPAKPAIGVEKGATGSGKVAWIQKVGPYAVAGLGVIALGAGGWFGMQAMGNATTANGLSPKSAGYGGQVTSLADSAKSNATLANAALIGGGVLVAAGSVWWFLTQHTDAPPSRRPTQVEAAPAVAPVPMIGVAPSSFSLTWSF